MTHAFGAMTTWDFLPEKRAFWATHSFKLYDYLYNNKAINITEYYQLISYILRFNTPRRAGVGNKEYIKLYTSYAQLFNYKVEL